MSTVTDTVDIFVIGGGINGVGVAADAAGRGLSVVLCEQGDLGSGTSSASTKLIHGGLRYLEYYEFMLVKKALKEREVLLRSAPHIIRPLKFLLPHHKGLRPSCLIRLGLFLYDHLGGRELLPASKSTTFDGSILKDEFVRGFEYSDCRVDDARLVILNAMRARDHGANILPRHKCIRASREFDHWKIEVEDTASGHLKFFNAKALVNAAGPWVDKVISGVLQKSDEKLMRLVKGSHIILEKIFSHDKAYLFQGADGRIIFAIPYLDDFTLIGTTDQEFDGDLAKVEISDEEVGYLCEKASVYFKKSITKEDVIECFAGVRPLYNDGASEAQEATRDFVLKLEKGQAPLLNIIGGKITTYRVLAEKVLKKLKRTFPQMKEKWTADASLPGGEFKVSEFDLYLDKLAHDYPFLDQSHCHRLMSSYGLKAWKILKDVKTIEDLGQYFGADLYEVEVIYLVDHEWARTVDDILRRRTKLYLKMNADQKDVLIDWLEGKDSN